jgi:DNA-binding LacI/PurR family transcriptional regulator
MPAGRPDCDGALLTDAFAAQLATGIATNAFPTGGLLPSERELVARHAVARITVRRALRKLAAAGMLECLPRVGYRVVQCRPDLAGARPIALLREDVTNLRTSSKSIDFLVAAFARAGRALLVGSSHLDAAEEDECIRRFRAAGAAALIVVPATRGGRSRELEAWIRAGMPVVLEGHAGHWLLPDDLVARCDRIDTDNRGVVCATLVRLVELGHTRLAWATSGTGATSERLDAFRAFVTEHALPWADDRVITRVSNDRAGGEAVFRALFSNRPSASRPTAVITSGSDNIALGLIQAAHAAGVRCPQDLSVVSFSDNRVVEDTTGLAALSTIEPLRPDDDVEAHVRLLLEQLSGVRRAPRQVRLPLCFRERASCGAAPGAHGAASATVPDGQLVRPVRNGRIAAVRK